MYKLKEIKDKKIWDDFIINNDFNFYSFIASWDWWEFKKDFWFPVLRYGIYNQNNDLIWIIPFIKTLAKRWTYLFSPHTPLIKWDYFEVLKAIKDDLINIWKKEKTSFIRFNPPVENTLTNYNYFKNLWFRPAPIHEHAEETHLLDLNKTEEELFNQIRKKDRYYINRARKEWVKVRIDNKQDHIKTLIKMHQEHSKKLWYHPFSPKYIKNLYKHFKNNIETISTSYNWKIESILMTIKFWETCVYYIAASDIISKKFSPNYLCQFEAIMNAKKDGAKVYNFWWVASDDNPKHPLHGVSLFKRKFWGKDFFLIHAQDLIISPKYWITWLIESLRRIKRWYYYIIPKK